MTDNPTAKLHKLSASDPTLIMFYDKMAAAETSLQFLRAWANYMIYVDPKSIEGAWAMKASVELHGALNKLEAIRGDDL